GGPARPAAALGAVGPDGAGLLPARGRALDHAALARIRRRALAELERRARASRGARGPLVLEGRRVVLVDDGVATGATAMVAVQAARAQGAAEVVVAAPVAAPDARDALAAVADRVIVLAAPERFWAVGEWYDDFRQTDDAEVVRLLGR